MSMNMVKLEKKWSHLLKGTIFSRITIEKNGVA